MALDDSGSDAAPPAPDDNTEVELPAPDEEAVRVVLAVRHLFDFVPVNEWPDVAEALALRIIALEDTPPLDVAELRRRERWRLADLFTSEADALRTMSPEGLTPELVAFMLKLDHG